MIGLCRGGNLYYLRDFLPEMRVCVLQYAPAVKGIKLRYPYPCFKVTPSIGIHGLCTRQVAPAVESIKPRLPSPIFKATCFIGTKGLVLGKVRLLWRTSRFATPPLFSRRHPSSASKVLVPGQVPVMENEHPSHPFMLFSIQQTNPPPCCRRSCPAHSGNGFTLYLHCICALRRVLLHRLVARSQGSERRACIG